MTYILHVENQHEHYVLYPNQYGVQLVMPFVFLEMDKVYIIHVHVWIYSSFHNPHHNSEYVHNIDSIYKYLCICHSYDIGPAQQYYFDWLWYCDFSSKKVKVRHIYSLFIVGQCNSICHHGIIDLFAFLILLQSMHWLFCGERHVESHLDYPYYVQIIEIAESILLEFIYLFDIRVGQLFS